MVAITPDAPEVLQRFATRFDIGYPLLADVGGVVIDEFGLRNHNIVPNERQAAGIPFPGHFLLDRDGRVIAKAFTGDLRHRASGTTLVAETLGVYGGPQATVERDELRAVISLSTGRFYGGQEASVRVDIDIAPGWHVYDASIAAPYRPLAVELDVGGDLLAAHEVRWPAPEIVAFGVLGTLPVHSGHVVATGRMRLRWSPPPSIFGGLENAVRRRAIAPGAYGLACALRYQACRDDVCLEPQEVRFVLPLIVEPTLASASEPATDT